MKHVDKGDNAIPRVVFDLEKNDEIQEQRRKLISIPTTGSQIRYNRATAYINAMCKVPREDFTVGMMDRYIESLAVVGDYGQAYELSGEKIYKAIDDALRGKTKPCKCKPTVAITLEQGKPVETMYSNIFTKTRVFDQMTRQFVNLNACNTCGKLTV